MKFWIGLFAAMSASSSFAQSLTQTHWTLKTITCASGTTPASPPVTGHLRMDLHFYEKSQFDNVIVRPTDWNIVQGSFTESQDQLCMNSKTMTNPNQGTVTYESSLCGTFRFDSQNLFFVFAVTSPGGGDCPQNDPVTLTFDRMTE